VSQPTEPTQPQPTAPTADSDATPEITIDDFLRVQLKVGTIRRAEPHPNADRLVVLSVDVGEPEERQLVAGIRAAYAPEDLVDRQIVVVANLKPAKLRGVESRGMLLAASDDQGLALLQPAAPIRPGSRVK
jgi:methionyl-tRNA synthetase